MRRKGFTLVEVLIVVIILGILAAIGIPQLNKAVEKSRGAEAKVGFGMIRTAQGEFYAANDTYAAGADEAAIETNLDIDLTGTYWTWVVTNPDANTWTATATRTGTGPWAGQTYTIDQDGTTGGTWEFE